MDASQGSSSPTNENTSTAVEPVVKGGNEFTSFDELEGLHSLPSSGDSPKRHTAKDYEDKPAPKGEKKDSKEPKQKDEYESSEKREDSRKEDSEKPGSEKAKGEKADKGKEKEVEKVKTFKVKAGDKDIDLRSDTAFEVTVSGKKENVQLQELLNNYSGKVDYTRKYSEFDKEKKSFQTERTELQTSVNKLYELSKSDPRGAVEYLAEAMGGDPGKFWGDLKSVVLKSFEEYSALSPEERKAREAQDELTYLRQKDQSTRAAAHQAREQQAIEKRVTAVRDRFNIDEARFHQLYNELKTYGNMDPKLITPELVGDYHMEITSRQDLGKMLSDMNPELSKDAVTSAVRDMRKIMTDNPSFKMEDIREIAQQVYGKSGAKGLAKKVQQSRSSQPARRAADPRSEPLTWDDLG